MNAPSSTLLHDMHILRPISRGTTIATSAGSVQFESRKLWFYPPQFVWTTLQGLHRASLAGRPDGHHLPAQRARAAYVNGLTAAMGQFWIASDHARCSLFDRLLDAVQHARSFDGLESPFLSGFNTVEVLGDHARVMRAEGLWKSFGAPAHLGGGAQRAFVLDTSTSTVLFLSATAVLSLGVKGAHANLIASAAAHLAVQLPQAGLVDAGAAQDGDTCKGLFALGGAIVGGVVFSGAAGAATAGPGAVPAWAPGAALGASAGGIAGNLLCGWITAPSGSGGTGGAGGAGQGVAIDTTGDNNTGGPTNENAGTVDQTQSSSSEGGASSSQSESNSSQSSTEGPNASGNGSGSGSGDNSGSGSGDNSGSGSGDNSGTGSGNDNHSGDGGMPNPDDPHGYPDPNSPRGFGAITSTFPTGAGVASYLTRTSSGAWLCHGVAQLTDKGTVAHAGILAAIPGFAAQTVGGIAMQGGIAGVLASAATVAQQTAATKAIVTAPQIDAARGQ
jgi:hypothetical protein